VSDETHINKTHYTLKYRNVNMKKEMASMNKIKILKEKLGLKGDK